MEELSKKHLQFVNNPKQAAGAPVSSEPPNLPVYILLELSSKWGGKCTMYINYDF